MKGRFEIGRKLLRLLGSAPGVLSMGVIAAVLKEEGTRLELREECMMDVIRGERDGRQPLTKTVGIGSSWQVDGLDFRMRSEISSAEGSVKLESRRETGAEKVEKDGMWVMLGVSCW